MPDTPESPASEAEPDLVVLSDLHVGRGRNARTGRYFGLETFFYDEDLRRFLRRQCEEAEARGRRLRVVFNGDTFDFLRTEHESEAGSLRERRFGPDLTPARAAEICAGALAGHPTFVAALADVADRGHFLLFLPGNHDLEVQFTEVQEVLRGALRIELARRATPSLEEVLARVSFAPWFHHEPGRAWIEHGCQYDPECAFRYPLRNELPRAVDPDVFELDMPLGNFFQRYLYNAFGALTFIVPSTRANSRYSRWLLLNEPAKLLRVVASHVPFILQVLRRIARKGTDRARPLVEAHARGLARLAEASGLGDRLHRLDARKAATGDLVQAVRQYGLHSLKFVLGVAAAALFGASIWLSALQSVDSVENVGLRAVALLALNFVLMGLSVGGVVWLVVRQAPAPEYRPLTRAAGEIAQEMDVPIVVFGHTHDEQVTRLEAGPGDRWYFNTGTWIAVFTHDVLLPRKRVQYTFLRLRGRDAQLLHWNPDRAEAVPVVLLDEPADPVPIEAEPAPIADR